MNTKRIVITGVGVIAPNGIGKEHFWQSLKDGKSGIKPISRFDTSEFKCKLGGEIKDFKAEDYLGSKNLKGLDRTSRLLCSAAKMAIDDSGLAINDRTTDEIGVCTGTTFSYLWNFSELAKEIVTEGPRFIDAALFPGTVINAASSHVSIRFNIQGFNTTVSTGYSSSLDAVKYATDFIKLGRIKAVLVGGVESLSLANFIGFYNLGFFAGLKGEEVSCPFDKRRNGIILSEGAAVVVIEDEEYALERNAPIYAEVKGSGCFFDAYRIGKYKPDAEGLKQSMLSAIRNSDLNVTEIDHISASANSVAEQDRLETVAIKEIFGKQAYSMPISSIKSMIGEPFSAGGLLQIAASVGSIKQGFVPPTLNYRLQDEVCDFDYVDKGYRNARINNTLINNFGPGGSNASLVVSRFQ